jgi:hypothetical protein
LLTFTPLNDRIISRVKTHHSGRMKFIPHTYVKKEVVSHGKKSCKSS